MEDKKKILVVDDSDLVAGMLVQYFEAEQYRVVRAKNGIHGLEMAYQEIPDLIIMDVEMPLMQGYQASRLLKSKRGVKDIPIIMHTSLSEDKDKYWGMTSGVDEYAVKNFDNLENLKAQVQSLIHHPPYNIDVIKEDAGQITRERIFEMMGTLFDQQLFQSTILNLLGEIGRSIGSLEETNQKILSLLPKVCDAHIAVIILKYQRRCLAFILPEHNIYQNDVEEFLSVCLNDFYTGFPDLDLSNYQKTLFNLAERDDYEKIRLDKKRISSYLNIDLRGKGGVIIGSLHIGNLTNNYFSDLIKNNILVFAEGAGIILENSILFNHISEMEDKIRNVFAKFVPKEIIDDLIQRKDDEELLIGEKRRVVILFSDIRSFTSISENNSAENVVNFLNKYFDIMVNIIKKYGGTIDKFIGDAILAIFGAPKSYEDNALRAVRAAQEMILSLREVKTAELSLPKDGFNIGIGIHEGTAIVGNIGSADKFDYTVIGDTVNLSSRLEGLSKYYEKQVIMSEEVVKNMEKQLRLESDKQPENQAEKEKGKTAGFCYREVDFVKVKGKEQPTGLYALETEADFLTVDFMNKFKKALKLYKMGNWETALEYFLQCLEDVPDDPICRMFKKRCSDFIENPPEKWDGTVALDFK